MNYNSLQGFYPTKCPLALLFHIEDKLCFRWLRRKVLNTRKCEPPNLTVWLGSGLP